MIRTGGSDQEVNLKKKKILIRITDNRALLFGFTASRDVGLLNVYPLFELLGLFSSIKQKID